MWKTLAVAALVLSITGCSAATGSRVSSSSGPITAEMIQEAHASDAYTAVQTLRPQWLRTRGQNSITQEEGIAVFLDNANMGGIGALRNIPVSSIAAIEFLDAQEATFRWGSGYPHGAILVRTN